MKMLDELNKLQIQINELKKQAMADQYEWPDKWPVEGDTYYTHWSTGDVSKETYFSGCSSDKDRNTNNMCFKTKEEATLSMQQALAYRMLWKLADGGEYVISKNGCGEYKVNSHLLSKNGMPKFSTIDKAQAAIITLGTDLLDTIFDHGEK